MIALRANVIPSGLDISLPVAKVDAAFRALGGLLGHVAEFLASPEGQAFIVDGLITIDDLLKVIGLVVPPVAVIASDLSVGIAIYQAAQPIIIWLEHVPAPDTAGTINVMGSLMSPVGIFQ